jgi:hypothetical protein
MEPGLRRGSACGHHFAIFWAAQWAMLSSSQALQASMPVTSIASPAAKRPLTEADAVEIWIARWLRIRRKDLIARYACDPRRLYEIWEEKRFADSRAKAMTLFRERFPNLVDRIDYGPHRAIPRRVPMELQPDLFEHL